MVNTLRITSVVAVLIASVLLVLVVGPESMLPQVLAKFAMGGDEEIERILDAPGVVDRFRENQGTQNQIRKEATPPLVKQAEVFAGIITPRKPVSPVAKTGSRGGVRRPPVIKPVPTSAKFNLVGTAYSASDPEASFAYIRLADDTYQWVRKGDEVGHLQVKEIKNCSIICWDGHSDVEMVADPAPETGSVLEASGASAAQSGVPIAPAKPAEGRITGPPVPRPWAPGRPAAAANPNLRAKDRERMEELVGRIRESAGAGAAASPEDRAAMMKKLMAEFKSSRVGAEEAESVEDLGRELNESQQTPPSSTPGGKRTHLRKKLTIPTAPKK